MPQLNTLATKYAAKLQNMTMDEFVRWRVFGAGCSQLVTATTMDHVETWEEYDITINLWCQLSIAPLIVTFNFYIFVRILVAEDVLKKTFGPIAFQAIVDVIFTGLFLIIHDLLYIWFNKQPLSEGGVIKFIYTATTASYNINAFNTSAVLIHLAMDRLLTVKFAFMSARVHAIIRNTSFTMIVALTSYCVAITFVHAAFVQTSFDQSYVLLERLYRFFWIQIPSMYIMTYLYSAVIISTVFFYSYIAILFRIQAKKKLGNLSDIRWQRNKQITKLFFLSTLAYVVFWFPEVFHAFFWQWDKVPCLFTRYYNFKYANRFGFFIDWLKELLFYVYSVVNPLIFISTQKNFHWAALKKDLHRIKLRNGRKLITKESIFPLVFRKARGDSQVSGVSQAKPGGAAEIPPSQK